VHLRSYELGNFSTTSVVVVVVVAIGFVVLVVVSATGMIATVGGTAITHFLLPNVQVNTAYSMFWVKESGYGT
jgi:hypothetical protein